MFYLNTTRHLLRPLDTDRESRLTQLLDTQVAPTAGATPGIQSIGWLLSDDQLTLSTFSGWLTPGGPTQAEKSPTHMRNSELINELLGDLREPQIHARYKQLAHHDFH